MGSSSMRPPWGVGGYLPTYLELIFEILCTQNEFLPNIFGIYDISFTKSYLVFCILIHFVKKLFINYNAKLYYV